MFNERNFPYQYECKGCGCEATVTHEGVQDVPSFFRMRTAAEAAKYVMTNRRDWSITARGPLCPNCESGLSTG
jgi:hypothetical protein